jgi:AcrR family transcriptional regulator
LHRCLQRHGISRLPEIAGDKPAKQPFKRYPIGYFHIDIAEVCTEEGKLYLFVAEDRTTKYACGGLVKKATGAAAGAFLDELAAAVPYQIHTVLTDNGIQFADLPKNRDGPTASWRGHPFDRACQGHGIEHRLTKSNHPWTNGQAERMNRTLKEATIRRYHYETHRQLEDHLATFLDAYNFARRLKTLRGLVGVDEVVDRAGVTKPSLYRSFASKDDLAAAYMRDYDLDFWEKLKQPRGNRTAMRASTCSPIFVSCPRAPCAKAIAAAASATPPWNIRRGPIPRGRAPKRTRKSFASASASSPLPWARVMSCRRKPAALWQWAWRLPASLKRVAPPFCSCSIQIRLCAGRLLARLRRSQPR